MAGLEIKRKILNQVPLYSMNWLTGEEVASDSDKAHKGVL